MEDLREILGISDSNELDEEQVQQDPITEPKHDIDNSAEKALGVVANIALVLGCLIIFIGLCGLIAGIGDHKYEQANMGFLCIVVGGMSGITTWAVLKVLRNISLTLKEIKSMM